MTDTPKPIPPRMHILFDGPPGAEAGRFVEVVDDAGRGINAGTWAPRPDGTWSLTIDRAAVVADSPELAQARADASRRLAERDEERAIIDGLRAALGLKPGVGLDLAALTAVARDKLSEDDMESADVVDGLVRESLELRALAEDELAQARERIAALEADTAGYRADLAALEVRHGRMVDAGVELGTALTEALRRGDAALARVRELEAEFEDALAKKNP